MYCQYIMSSAYLSDRGWRRARGTWGERCCLAPPSGTGTPPWDPTPATPSPEAARSTAPGHV